jgi:hypothetical protein
LQDRRRCPGRYGRRYGRALDLKQANAGIKMLSIAKELASYMSARKKWWLMPVITILVVVGGLLVLAQGSAVAPFIYTLF